MPIPSRIAILGDGELPEGVADLLDELEARGWPCRARRGMYGVVVWPDGGRRRQHVIDTRYPMNEHRLEEIREFTAISDLGAGLLETSSSKSREGATDEH